MTAEGGMAFGYYKEGAHNPTFAYISKALEAEKVHTAVTLFCSLCDLRISDEVLLCHLHRYSSRTLTPLLATKKNTVVL